MEKTIVQFQKQSKYCKIIRSNYEVDMSFKASMFHELAEYIRNKELKMKLKKVESSYKEPDQTFIMSNDDYNIVVNFEDKKDLYCEDFNNIYLEKKLREKGNRVRKFKKIAKRFIAVALITTGLGAYGHFIHERDDKIIAIMDEQTRIMTEAQKDGIHINPETAYKMAIENINNTKQAEQTNSINK